MPTNLSSVELQRWRTRSAGKDFLKRASEGWSQAEIAAGEKPAKASKRAARSFGFRRGG